MAVAELNVSRRALLGAAFAVPASLSSSPSFPRTRESSWTADQVRGRSWCAPRRPISPPSPSRSTSPSDHPEPVEGSRSRRAHRRRGLPGSAQARRPPPLRALSSSKGCPARACPSEDRVEGRLENLFHAKARRRKGRGAPQVPPAGLPLAVAIEKAFGQREELTPSRPSRLCVNHPSSLAASPPPPRFARLAP